MWIVSDSSFSLFYLPNCHSFPSLLVYVLPTFLRTLLRGCSCGLAREEWSIENGKGTKGKGKTSEEVKENMRRMNEQKWLDGI